MSDATSSGKSGKTNFRTSLQLITSTQTRSIFILLLNESNMSRRSAQKKTAVGSSDAAAAAEETPSPILDMEVEVDDGPVAHVDAEPEAEPPAPSASVPSKGKAKKARAAPKKKDEAEAAPASPAASAQKKKKAPKKKGEKRARQVDGADDEEEAVIPEEAAPVDKVERVIKRSEAGRAQGSRFESVKGYRGQLKKHRESAPDTKKDKDGKEVPIVHRKAKPGAVAKREVKFLSKANGLFLGTALVRRLCGDSIKRALPIVRAENARTASRLEARGKTVPQNLTVAEKWSVSPGVVQLARGAVQERVNQVSMLGSILRQHAGRETILERDIATGIEILRQFN